MDLTLDEEGSRITTATSYDLQHPPSSILDGSQVTKWMTTGNFPQEVVIQLGTTASVSRIRTWTKNVKDFSVEICTGPTPIKWEKVFDKKFSENDGNMQVEAEQVRVPEASFLKCRIVSGWKDFAAVHRISAEGSAARR